MPGILYHLSFADMVYRKLLTVVSFSKKTFMEGNLIPDLAVDKWHSHYRKEASFEGFFVPDMEMAKRELFDVTDSLKFGMYCHLYLDHYFIEEFLIPEFIWDTKNMLVTNPKNNKQWDTKTFFSASGMYGAYTEMSNLMIKNGHISIEVIEKIPEILPVTGIPIFDNRRKKTWKEELNEYLTQDKNYKGEIFDHHQLWECIKMIADKLANEISQ